LTNIFNGNGKKKLPLTKTEKR